LPNCRSRNGIAGRLCDSVGGTSQGDRLDVLATLIDAYEAEHYPIDPPDPVEAIKFRMEQQWLSRKDLEPFIGTRTRVAEVLNRKRNLSIGMIRPSGTNGTYVSGRSRSPCRHFRVVLITALIQDAPIRDQCVSNTA
jgi:antitoxin component HigA of HigAB toxin-antitoxin module